MTDTTVLHRVLRLSLPSDLMAASQVIALHKGTTLFRIRQHPRQMVFVASGEVVLERVGRQGGTVVLQRVRHGFVAAASLESARYHCDARVTAAGQGIALPIHLLRTTLARDPAFALRWIGLLNAEVRRLRAQCERMSLKGVAERLLHLIETEGEDGRLAIPSGLKSVATELGVSHEALYRTVAALERENVVLRDAGCLVLR